MGKRLESTPRSKVRKDTGKPKRDITGLRSGRLVAIRFARMDPNGHGAVWECKCDCGNTHFTRMTHIAQQKTLSCGCLKKEMFAAWREGKIEELNPMWKGGKTIRGGYVMLLNPNRTKEGQRKYVPEHRYVMSQMIGRTLNSLDVVHHRNGVKTDNRPENLELLTKNTHKGVVVCPHCHQQFLIR